MSGPALPCHAPASGWGWRGLRVLAVLIGLALVLLPGPPPTAVDLVGDVGTGTTGGAPDDNDSDDAALAAQATAPPAPPRASTLAPPACAGDGPTASPWLPPPET